MSSLVTNCARTLRNMQGQSSLPEDFPARMRAGRAYAGDMSQAELAKALDMSPGYVKNVEGGKGLKDLEARALLERLPEITGLPRSFFAGTDAEPDRLAAIQDLLEALRVETEARDLEVIRLLGEEREQG